MKKSTKYMMIVILLLSLISMITYGYTYAKYVSNQAWNYYLGSKGFYFSSEQLGTTKKINVNNNWNFDSTYFTLKNSENDFLISDYDIEYTVKCTIQNEASNYSKCVLKDSNSDIFSGVISSSGICINIIDETDVSTYNQEKCEANGYEWEIEENYKDLYFDIIKTSEESIDYVSVLIEVTTTSPYSKTLLGEFNLSSSEIQESALKITYHEFSNYSRIIVSNSYDENKCVKLNWNSDNFRIDETNDNILSYQYDSNNYINEINFNINKKDNISFIFYKSDFNKSYDYQEFSLVELKLK